MCIRDRYSDKPVEDKKIIKCLQAVHLAPSACNAQPWKFIVVNEPNLKNQIADATSKGIVPINHFTKQAPVHVVVIMERPNISSTLGSVIKDKPYNLIDIGIATAHFCLQATELGLGTCICLLYTSKQLYLYLPLYLLFNII